MLTQVLQILYHLAIRGIRVLIVPGYVPGRFFPRGSNLDIILTYIGLAVYIIILCLSVIVLTPLEVLATRLSVQKNHPGGPTALSTFAPGVGLEEDVLLANEGSEYAGTEEDVISFRDETTPYISLVDAYEKVKAEEGRNTLYRLWWLTLLGTLLAGFV